MKFASIAFSIKWVELSLPSRLRLRCKLRVLLFTDKHSSVSSPLWYCVLVFCSVFSLLHSILFVTQEKDFSPHDTIIISTQGYDFYYLLIMQSSIFYNRAMISTTHGSTWAWPCWRAALASLRGSAGALRSSTSLLSGGWRSYG